MSGTTMARAARRRFLRSFMLLPFFHINMLMRIMNNSARQSCAHSSKRRRLHTRDPSPAGARAGPAKRAQLQGRASCLRLPVSHGPLLLSWYTRMYICIYIHTHIHVYSYMYIYIYVWDCVIMRGGGGGAGDRCWDQGMFRGYVWGSVLVCFAAS